MMESSIIIQNNRGIHCRPAGEIVNKARQFKSDIFLQKENEKIDAKVLIDILTLALHKGEKVSIIVDGIDEKNALEEISKIVSKRFSFD